MRTEAKLFLFLGLFMLPLGLIYAFVGDMTTGIEIAGTIMLLVVAIAFAFIGVYLSIQARRMNGLRPEDWDATQADGEGEVGAFPVASIYPFLGALGATLLGFALTFSMVLAVPGFFLIFLTVIGMARESVISEYGHFELGHDATEGNVEPPTFSDNVKK